MYSNSPGNDLYYMGDSFDNLDFIDINKIRSNRMALVKDGSAKLPVINTVPWLVSTISIDQEDSNGLIGNNHAVFDTQNVDTNTKYYFEKDPRVGLIGNIIDDIPDTYFEYEAINIPTSERISRGAKEFEFFYSKQAKVNNQDVTQYSSWADHGLDQSLNLTLILESERSQKMNSLTVVPFFGQADMIYPEVEIYKVIAVNSDTNEVVDLISSSIFIGNTIVPQTIESMKNYNYEQCVIDFPEIKTKFIKVYFKQKSYNNVKVKHLYWKPSTTTAIEFRNQSRFNPEILASTGYEQVSYNVSELIPGIKTPNQFKLNTNESTKMVRVSAVLPHEYLTKHVIKYSQYINHATPTPGQAWATPNTFDLYFQGKGLSQINGKPVVGSYLNPAVAQVDTRYIPTLSIANAERYDSITSAETKITYIKSGFVTNALQAINFLNMVSEEVTLDIRDQRFTKDVNLQKQYELYNAKKWTISINSIQPHYNIYSNVGEIVSKSFEFPYNLKTLMISSETSNKVTGSTTIGDINNIRYYISTDDGNNWISISPIENPFSGIPEILSFNENVEGSVRIPGVSYFNYPKVPREIRKIRVKIEFNKPTSSNISPILHSYKLSAKVEQV
jgi:hypothetical protein